MAKNMESRQIQTKVELRQNDEDEQQTIEGYALKFNKPSDILAGFFREKIDPHALDQADMSNVVATFNHDQSQVLGRSGVNLDLAVDNIGLKFRIKPTDTQLARDLMVNIGAGIINQCSFAFTVPDNNEAQEWTESTRDGVDYERTIRQIDHLYDVSVVTTPAYPDTEATVGQRSIDMVKRMQSKQ